MTSPSSSFMMLETKAMRSGTGKIMALDSPRCLTCPLTEKCKPTRVVSPIFAFGMSGLGRVSRVAGGWKRGGGGEGWRRVKVRKHAPDGEESVKALGGGPRE